MLFMLRDKNYFAVESTQIGTVNSELIFNAMVFTIPISLVSGYCYDLFGRKLLIIVNSLLMCLLCYLTPYTSPSLGWLQASYVLVRGTLIFVSCNPLMADYVDKLSLGKASAL
jgi:MFS family permease